MAVGARERWVAEGGASESNQGGDSATLTAKKAEQSLRGHGRASQWDEGVAPGVRTRMACGPQLRAAIARSSPLCQTLRQAHMVHTVSSSCPRGLGSLLGPSLPGHT